MALANINNQPAPKPVKGPPCAVCEALNTLPDTEATALRQLLSDTSWRYEALSQALRADEDNPLDIAAPTLGRHARGRCAAREVLRG